MKKIAVSFLYVGLLGLSTSIALIPSDHFVVSEKGHSIDFKSKDPSGIFKDFKALLFFNYYNYRLSSLY